MAKCETRWAYSLSLGESSKLSEYSSADSYALELAYIMHSANRAKSNSKGKTLVRVVPAACPKFIRYTVDVASMQQQNMNSKIQRTVV